MKVSILIISLVLFIIVAYLLWLKVNRKGKAKKINEILFQKYIGESVKSIRESIKGKKFEIFLTQFEKDDFKYIITNSPSHRTSIIYQFNKDRCTSFAIESSEEWYSLPYWNYIKEYANNTKNIPFRLSPKDDAFQLADYTLDKYLEPFKDTETEFTTKLDYFFKKYYKVNETRYLAIDLDEEESRKRPYPVYLYLCSSRVDYMEILRDQLYRTDNTRVKG